MKKVLSLLFLCVFTSLIVKAQDVELQGNIADKLLNSKNGLVLGGYGEVHYNQPLDSEVRRNGKLDVHRMVVLVGYNFSDRVRFVTELEFEHVKEVYVEQAFLQYKLNDYINFRGGLMLVPMGTVNLYHEPTTFHGVERPLIDQYIAPSTWREIGFGIAGSLKNVSLKYELYMMNGFNGYDGTLKFDGKKGLRSGRQKGINSYVSSPNFTARLDYYGIKGLRLGLSGYYGKSQTTAFDGILKDDDKAFASADSTRVGLGMLGVDARYEDQGLQLRGQFYYSGLSNTEAYNAYQGASNDLGSAMMGYYIEAAYNVLRFCENSKTKLYPFVRYEGYNTHQKVAGDLVANDSYNKTAITTGLTWMMFNGAAFKMDMQWVKDKASDKYQRTLSAGIAVNF